MGSTVLSSVIFLLVLAYIGTLFWIARLSNKHFLRGRQWPKHPLVYSLAIGVYCTSWTFYGLVGTAAESGWQFLPILLGPFLLFTVGYPLIKRVAEITREENLRSIADFLASRYGKRQSVASITALVLLTATVPYIALQLKAVSDSLILLIGSESVTHVEITLATSIAMVGFSLLFGTQRIGGSNYNAGLVSAIAFESLVKLIAMGVVTIVSIALILQHPEQPSMTPENTLPSSVFDSFKIDIPFLVQSLVSAAVVLCLPRMFHICFVENQSEQHLKTARILFPLYLLLVAAFIVSTATAGNILYGDSQVSGDHFALAVPIEAGFGGLSIITFLGGFSAATAMIIVATITLSQILSNDIILPFIIKRNQGDKKNPTYTPTLLIVRRTTVILVIALAYLYQRTLINNLALTSIGLLAFALAVQLSPSIVFGVYWRRGNASGVYAGLLFGVLIWFFALIIPLLNRAGFGFDLLLQQGLWHISWLRPEHLFGFEFGDTYSRGVIISLSFNTLAYIAFSSRFETVLLDRIQAQRFTKSGSLSDTRGEHHQIEISDLRFLLTQFLGEDTADQVLDAELNSSKTASQPIIMQAERALAGVTGVATARSLIGNIQQGKAVEVEDVFSIVKETAQALRFNQDILFSSFENIPTGISVVNSELQLVAWNNRYVQTFDFPSGYLQIGMPIVDIVRFNAKRGLLGPGSVSLLVERRMSKLLESRPYQVRRQHNTFTILEIKGSPLPSGGYVTTYDDISEFIEAQNELEIARDELEQRVIERTKTIEQINQDLIQEIGQREKIEKALLLAKAEAEEANSSKSQFLALASHDILQPLNAAKLFTDALSEHHKNSDTKTFNSLRTSIDSAANIISTLLEIAKLDTGAMQPHFSNFYLDDILSSLADEYSVLLEDSTQLHYVKTGLAVYSDKMFLRRIVQNFLSNAIKYGEGAKILMGCKRRNNGIEICIIDAGPGINEIEQARIFEDFYRSKHHQGQEGAGLGLAVTTRLSTLLRSDISLVSRQGSGSCFSISVQRAQQAVVTQDSDQATLADNLRGLTAYCVDDDHRNLEALTKLLSVWGCISESTREPNAAINYANCHPAPNIILMDYQLGEDQINGVELAKQLKTIWHNTPVCIVSAAPMEELRSQANLHGFAFLRKPIKPAKLRALLANCR